MTKTKTAKKKIDHKETKGAKEEFSDADFERLIEDLKGGEGDDLTTEDTENTEGEEGAKVGTCEGEKEEKGEEEEGKVQERSLVVPILEKEVGYACRRFSVTLSRDQARGLRKVTDGLKALKVELPNGRKVKDHRDTVKWIFESLN